VASGHTYHPEHRFGWDSADGGWRLAAVTYFSGGRIS
jgi:hypothetical protein